jgi:hypothetical protein
MRVRGESVCEIRSGSAPSTRPRGLPRRGEVRLLDDKILAGWYAADERAVRAVGTL